MTRLSELPDMPAPATPADAASGVAEEMAGPMPCGGCGAKLGSDVLGAALARLPKAGRPDIELGAGDDAAILRIGGTRQVISTDHLRGFCEDAGLVARVAALHAMGDVWAMGAKPQAALAQITLPHMAAPLQKRTMAEIMAAARAAFDGAGAEIVGGHSTQGAELQIGFTVTGLLDGPAITTAGASPGDTLILTRAIGSGVILAAEMAMKAPGSAVTALWDTMTKPQGDAAAILARHATAMTDVTGFGLAGHLSEICAGSGLGANIALDEIPLFDGALALAESGAASTLMPANRAALAGRISGADGPCGALLFDPQTAGGFLAAVPEAAAEALIGQLRASGHGAARIGHLAEGVPGITVV